MMMKAKNESQAMHLAETLGYLSADEVRFLRLLARSIEKRSPVIVNIGAGAGTSGLAFREARPDADLTTIDIRALGPLGGLEGERNAFDIANLRYPHQILGDSKAIAEKWKKPVDLLFVDGDHSEDGIRGDINGWLPHVVEDGIIAMHDYEGSEWDGNVKPVTDELLSHNEMIRIEDSIIAFRKTNG